MTDSCRTHCHGHASPVGAPAPLGGLDTLAALISSLCLVHCVALPVAIALLPALALVIPDMPWLHAGLLLVAVPASGLALLRGWRIHRDRVPATVGAAGLAVMASALLVATHGAAEVVLTVGGGLLVAAGHMLNLRAGGRAR